MRFLSVAPSTRSDWMLKLTVVSIAVSVVFAALGIAVLLRALYLSKTGVRTEGRIVGEVMRESGSYATYHLRFAFADREGKEHTVVSGIGRNMSYKGMNGTPVLVLYDPEAPESARIWTFGRAWGIPIVLIVSSALSAGQLLLIRRLLSRPP